MYLASTRRRAPFWLPSDVPRIMNYGSQHCMYSRLIESRIVPSHSSLKSKENHNFHSNFILLSIGIPEWPLHPLPGRASLSVLMAVHNRLGPFNVTSFPMPTVTATENQNSTPPAAQELAEALPETDLFALPKTSLSIDPYLLALSLMFVHSATPHIVLCYVLACLEVQHLHKTAPSCLCVPCTHHP